LHLHKHTSTSQPTTSWALPSAPRCCLQLKTPSGIRRDLMPAGSCTSPRRQGTLEQKLCARRPYKPCAASRPSAAARTTAVRGGALSCPCSPSRRQPASPMPPVPARPLPARLPAQPWCSWAPGSQSATSAAGSCRSCCAPSWQPYAAGDQCRARRALGAPRGPCPAPPTGALPPPAGASAAARPVALVPRRPVEHRLSAPDLCGECVSARPRTGRTAQRPRSCTGAMRRRSGSPRKVQRGRSPRPASPSCACSRSRGETDTSASRLADDGGRPQRHGRNPCPG